MKYVVIGEQFDLDDEVLDWMIYESKIYTSFSEAQKESVNLNLMDYILKNMDYWPYVYRQKYDRTGKLTFEMYNAISDIIFPVLKDKLESLYDISETEFLLGSLGYHVVELDSIPMTLRQQFAIEYPEIKFTAMTGLTGFGKRNTEKGYTSGSVIYSDPSITGGRRGIPTRDLYSGLDDEEGNYEPMEMEGGFMSEGINSDNDIESEINSILQNNGPSDIDLNSVVNEYNPIVGNNVEEEQAPISEGLGELISYGDW